MAPKSVHRRLVFYIHGFDPRSPRTYYNLYRDQAAIYVDRHGDQLDVSAFSKTEDGGGHWAIAAVMNGTSVHTKYIFLSWGDLVSRELSKSVWEIVADGLWTAKELLSTGQWANIRRASLMPALLIAYAELMILVFATLAVGLGYAASVILSMAGAPAWSAWMAWIVVAMILLRYVRLTDRRWYVFHLLTSFNDSVRQARGERPVTEQRLNEFAASISRLSRENYDEVLVVGHSVGAYQALAVMARVLSMPTTDAGAKFSLLTLGQNVPFASFHPAAEGLRYEIAQVAADRRVDWLDVSGPNDWLAHVWLDVTAPPDVPKLPGYRPPLVITNRPFEAFSRRTLSSLAFDFFQTHFLYMYANEAPTDWDWFKVTAGSQKLFERYGTRKPAADAGRMGQPDAYKISKRSPPR